MNAKAAELRWYEGITRYQWTVLVIACLGWSFDVFEGQLFAVFKTPAMADVMGLAETDPLVDRYANVAFAFFLAGGAVGGLFFGMLADRIGRKRSMILSILTYSLFTGLHYFAQTWWHIAGLRFLVAMGVGGEWAIAASIVSEVFPRRSRAAAGGIFHASSVLGAVLASLIGIFLYQASDWRVGFLTGLLPALLVAWIMNGLQESEKWKAAKSGESKLSPRLGSLHELMGDPVWRGRALLGLGLASIGLGTYWSIYVWGPELVHEVLGDSVSPEERRSAASLAYLVMNFTGGFAGLLAFAPITTLTNRRAAFAIYHVAALAIVPITFLAARTYLQTLILLPIMAFFVVGMHAGYAIYFPELFPTRLRATGSSFCFNVGRLVSAVMLLVRGELRSIVGLRYAVALMSLLFIVGLALLLIAPETKGKELPE